MDVTQSAADHLMQLLSAGGDSGGGAADGSGRFSFTADQRDRTVSSLHSADGPFHVKVCGKSSRTKAHRGRTDSKDADADAANACSASLVKPTRIRCRTAVGCPREDSQARRA